MTKLTLAQHKALVAAVKDAIVDAGIVTLKQTSMFGSNDRAAMTPAWQAAA